MRPQFFNADTAAKKTPLKGKKTSSTANIEERLCEAGRIPGYCKHIQDPQDPNLVYGKPLSAVRQRVEVVYATVKDKRGYSIRQDTPVLFTVVVSYPDAVSTNPTAYNKWKKKSIKFMLKKWGTQVISIIEHLDEAYPHLHCFIVSHDGLAKSIHPGYVARKTAGNAGFKKAMRDLQDEYFEDVGKPCGLSRASSYRARLTRSEYLKKKAIADKNKKIAELLAAMRVAAIKQSKRLAYLEAENEKLKRALASTLRPPL